MSRRRNRTRSVSSQGSQRTPRASPKTPLRNSTTISVSVPGTPITPRRGHSCDLRHNQTLYNKNISFFRDNFNQNDTSQLPFMSSLRQKPTFKPQTANKSTIVEPFETSLKTTSTMTVKKNVSDFSSNQRRLSGAYYRWHNGSGRNNKWAVDFECSLRDYSPSTPQPTRKEFYPYVQPIQYLNYENLSYNPEEILFRRTNRSFLIR